MPSGVEAFWARMQVELLNRKKWHTRVELANAMFEYLEIFHNRQRRHSALGMHTPIEYEISTRPVNPRHETPEKLVHRSGGRPLFLRRSALRRFLYSATPPLRHDAGVGGLAEWLAGARAAGRGLCRTSNVALPTSGLSGSLPFVSNGSIPSGRAPTLAGWYSLPDIRSAVLITRARSANSRPGSRTSRAVSPTSLAFAGRTATGGAAPEAARELPCLRRPAGRAGRPR